MTTDAKVDLPILLMTSSFLLIGIGPLQNVRLTLKVFLHLSSEILVPRGQEADGAENYERALKRSVN